MSESDIFSMPVLGKVLLSVAIRCLLYGAAYTLYTRFIHPAMVKAQHQPEEKKKRRFDGAARVARRRSTPTTEAEHDDTDTNDNHDSNNDSNNELGNGDHKINDNDVIQERKKDFEKMRKLRDMAILQSRMKKERQRQANIASYFGRKF